MARTTVQQATEQVEVTDKGPSRSRDSNWRTGEIAHVVILKSGDGYFGIDTVLSQDDIDSLVGSSSDIDDQKPAPAKPQAAQPSAAAPASPKPASAGAAGSAGAAPADIAQRLAKLEAAVSKAGQSNGGELAVKVEALEKQVREISSRVDEILQHLPNTMGYGVHETFQCGACGTQGLVAAHVMCTHRGTQTQLGWWART